MSARGGDLIAGSCETEEGGLPLQRLLDAKVQLYPLSLKFSLVGLYFTLISIHSLYNFSCSIVNLVGSFTLNQLHIRKRLLIVLPFRSSTRKALYSKSSKVFLS